MKQFKIMFGLAMGLVAGILLAQTDTDYQGWMKQAVAANGKLKGDIAAKNAEGATTNAKAIESAFKQIEDYWTKKSVTDAANLAKTARTAAAAIPPAVSAGNFEEAGKQAAAIGATCAPCHAAHREGEKGGPYKIK